MISRALPKGEHFALALHILKGSHPDLIPEKVICDFCEQTDKTKSNAQHVLNAKKKKLFSLGMGIVYHKFCFGG